MNMKTISKSVVSLVLSATLTISITGCNGSVIKMDAASTSGSEEAAIAETIGGDTEPTPVSFKDDLGREVEVHSADRVAIMIGSFADIWCIAGGKDSIVAAAGDTWTSFDLGLDESVADLGAINTPNIELLLASKPDLVIASCNTEANIEMMDTLDNAGITVCYFDVQHFNDYLRMLDICTMITGERLNYEKYGLGLKDRIEKAKAMADGSDPTVLCVRASGSSCKVKGSQDNLLGEMLADMGCINIADSNGSLLEELSMENIILEDPEYIFVVLQGSDPTNAENMLKESLLSNPAWSTLSAVKNDKFYILDKTLYNLKPNARWADAYEGLAEILYGQN